MALGILGPAFLVILLFIAGIIVVNVFYLLTLQNTLKEVQDANRKTAPTNVWLMFIPLFNLIYPFILYPQICDSVKDEYRYRGLKQDGDFGRGIGIALPILTLCSIVPILGILASMAHLVLFIIFWVKMSEFKTELANSPKAAGEDVSNDVNVSASGGRDLLDD